MNKEGLMNICAVVLDVDGTLTDGSIYYDNFGNEIKKFNTRDAAGIFAAKQVGIKIIVLTGRVSKAVERRMQDLKVDWIEQGVHNKRKRLIEIMSERNWGAENIAYIGDDLNDLPAMQMCGFVACPADAAIEVRKQADYVSEYCGGNGAVRDILRKMLLEREEWSDAIKDVYA